MGLSASVAVLGFASSQLDPSTRANWDPTATKIYRDGGGGGTVNGLHLVMYSDGIWTSDGKVPTENAIGGNWKKFTSNSISVSKYLNPNNITHMFDYGDAVDGPKEQIPYINDNTAYGPETSATHAIWPNQNMVTLCDGHCALSFPQVLRREGSGARLLYNTPVNVTVGQLGAVATRPKKALFLAGEPMFGSFCSYVGVDGYIYMYARTTETASGNGLKLARAHIISYLDRSTYQYWNGNAWVTNQVPADSNGAPNVLNWSKRYGTDTRDFGPGYGEVFWSQQSSTYVLLFQSAAAAFDMNVYISYSSKLEGPWSTPYSIWTLPKHSDGWSYSFHAYPNMDPTGKKIPISWNQYRGPQQFNMAWGEITFTKNS